MRRIDRLTSCQNRKNLVNLKNELILRIQTELSKVSEYKAKEIKNRLWEELGVMI